MTYLLFVFSKQGIMIERSILKRYLHSLWRINKEEPEEDTRNEILNEVSFKGANVWLLGFTMILACVGLNMNSVYALIGAMLMSPLLAPVFGIGFALATNNWKMLQRCAGNWILSITVSVVASTIYFLITPFTEATEALTAFSHAGIYDVLIAFFGGLAAFIGITRMSGMKVLAGVAVATACMPPLCTAGFGLATFQWNFFLGGLYLYFINSVYIGLAVMLLARYMNFKKIKAAIDRPFIPKLMYALALLSLVPASVYAWKLVKEKHLMRNIDQYITSRLNTENHTVLKKTVNLNETPVQVEVYMAGSQLTEEETNLIQTDLKAHGLDNLELVIHASPIIEEVQADPAILKQLILKQEQKIHSQDSVIQRMKLRLDSLLKK